MYVDGAADCAARSQGRLTRTPAPLCWQVTAQLIALLGSPVLEVRQRAWTALKDMANEGGADSQMTVAMAGGIERFVSLLKDGSVVAEVDAADLEGKTALHLAAAKSGRAMLLRLLAAGADPQRTDHGALTAEGCAVKAARDSNASMLWWYARAPPVMRAVVTARRQHGRGYSVVPTCECQFGCGMVVLAYVFFLVYMLPVVSGVRSLWGVYVLMLLSTPAMCFFYLKAWTADPGIIVGRPEALLQVLCPCL